MTDEELIKLRAHLKSWRRTTRLRSRGTATMGERCMNLTPLERKVLVGLDVKTVPNTYYVGFQELQDTLELSRDDVRRACRSLRRQGLAEYRRGLFTEDGEMAGAGYAVTREGHDLVDAGCVA